MDLVLFQRTPVGAAIIKREAASMNANAPERLEVFVSVDDAASDDEDETPVEGQATGVTAAKLVAAQACARCSSGTRRYVVARALESDAWAQDLTSEDDPALAEPAVVSGLGAQRTAGRHQTPETCGHLVRTAVSLNEGAEYDLCGFCARWLISICMSCGNGVSDALFNSMLRSIFLNLVLIAVGVCNVSLLSSVTQFTHVPGVHSFSTCDGTCTRTPGAHLSCVRCFRGYGRSHTLDGLQRLCKDKQFQTTSLTFATIDAVLESGPSPSLFPRNRSPISCTVFHESFSPQLLNSHP